MPTDEEMTLDEHPKYLRRMKKRYDKADRVERAHLLDDGTRDGIAPEESDSTEEWGPGAPPAHGTTASDAWGRGRARRAGDCRESG